MAKDFNKLSTARSSGKRLRHRPHVVNSVDIMGKGNVRYFSSTDADIYFGDLLIDEVVSINWQVQQNTMPIFGYNSYTFDDIALGNRVVSGQFVVNFTRTNYLQEALEALKKINRTMYSTDEPAKTNFTGSDRAKRNLPLWDKGFDIVIGYGENNETFNQVTILNACQITGCAQGLDYNGEPLVEMYSFVARDINYKSFSDYSTNNEATEDNKEDSATKPTETKKYINIKSSSINISGSNKKITIDYEMLDNAQLGNHFITINDNLDIPSFKVQKELKKHMLNELYYELSNTEVTAIQTYCSNNNMKKIKATFNGIVIHSSGSEISNENNEISLILDVIM